MAETTLRFELERATDCLVSWRSEKQNGKVASQLLIHDTDLDGKERKPKLVRWWKVADLESGQWRISYRQGLIHVTGPTNTARRSTKEQQSWYGYIAIGSAAISADTVVQQRGDVRLFQLDFAATVPAIEPTPEQNIQLAQARRLNQQLVQSYRSGKARDALEVALQAREIYKRVRGTEHPDYASSLNNLATLYNSMGKYARTEPLVIEARDIFKRVLGTDHPDFAISLNNLATLCESIGEYAKAEPASAKAFDGLLSAASKAIPAFSEAQAFNWLRKHQPRVDIVLGILRRHGNGHDARAYRFVWQSKFLATRLRSNLRRPPNGSDRAMQVHTRLLSVCQQLAGFVSATPSPNKREEFHARIRQAADRKEALEKQLAQWNPATGRALAIRDARINNLLALLPEGVAIVDLVRLADWEPNEKQIKWKERDGSSVSRIVTTLRSKLQYDAFVIKSDRQLHRKSITWVALGDAAPIDTAVTNWRAQSL